MAAFEAEARLTASNAVSLEDLRVQFGEVGIENGPRTGFDRRTSVSSEAYLARRFFLWKASRRLVAFPISIFHEDKPDFRVQEGDSEYGLEVTEACESRDGAEMAKLQRSSSPHLLGDFGGRGSGGYRGNAPETEVISDIRGALERKSQKPYIGKRPTDLLIYVNSNPARVINREEHLRHVEREAFDLGALRHAYLFWSSDRIVQIGARS